VTPAHVLVPEGTSVDWPSFVSFTPDSLPAVLASLEGPVVLVSDGIEGAAADAAAAVIRAHASPVVEVRLAHWDGDQHSPIGGAVRGVIAGFDAAGIREAVRFLESL